MLTFSQLLSLTNKEGLQSTQHKIFVFWKLVPWRYETTMTSSLVNKSGYLRLNDFCTEYILTQYCLHYLNQTHQKLGDLKEKLGCFSWKSVSVTFLDFSFYQNFLFCCVFFMPCELALGGTLLNKFTHPLRSLYNAISVLQEQRITCKI